MGTRGWSKTRPHKTLRTAYRASSHWRLELECTGPIRNTKINSVFQLSCLWQTVGAEQSTFLSGPVLFNPATAWAVSKSLQG